MKTSNKLLITLAATLIVLPIIVIAYNIKVHFRPYDGNDQITVSKVINTPFHALSIANNKSGSVYLNLIKDSKYAVKYPEYLKGLLVMNTDQDGQLQISFNENAEVENYRVEISVYAPHIDQLSVSNVADVELKTDLDSLKMNAQNLNAFRFSDQTSIRKLDITANQVNDFLLNTQSSTYLKLALKDVNFKSGLKNYGVLAISTAGNTDLNFNWESDMNTQIAITKFSIQTVDKTNITLPNAKISSISGSLSDQTMVNMPVIYLKQLFK
jgi:hypothetical protein